MFRFMNQGRQLSKEDYCRMQHLIKASVFFWSSRHNKHGCTEIGNRSTISTSVEIILCVYAKILSTYYQLRRALVSLKSPVLCTRYFGDRLSCNCPCDRANCSGGRYMWNITRNIIRNIIGKTAYTWHTVIKKFTGGKLLLKLILWKTYLAIPQSSPWHLQN